MFSFDAMACLAFGAITAVAIRAAKDSFISHDEDCWHSQHLAPDTLDTLTDVMTKALGQQCRSEMQGLMKNLVEECAKIEGHSERDCISDLFTWLTGQSSRTHFAAQLAKPPEEAMLWAGFYDGDPRGLTHKVVQKNNDLHGCRGDPGALRRCFKDIKAGSPFWDRGPVLNFWVGASQAFVRGVASQKQASVVAVVNKELDPNEEWSLKESLNPKP